MTYIHNTVAQPAQLTNSKFLTSPAQEVRNKKPFVPFLSKSINVDEDPEIERCYKLQDTSDIVDIMDVGGIVV